MQIKLSRKVKYSEEDIKKVFEKGVVFVSSMSTMLYIVSCYLGASFKVVDLTDDCLMIEGTAEECISKIYEGYNIIRHYNKNELMIVG